MSNLQRNCQLNIRLSEKETTQIEKNMKIAGIKNKSAYIRKMILDGYVIHLDFTPLKDCASALGSVGNNLNQIARIANTYYEIDIPVLQECRDELHACLNCLRDILDESDRRVRRKK